ncbi:MAG: alpha/beta fold hydrolase [Actinomycetota bacterium]|nr:alpha/beta fold hydrolase [Actinomycetota bacterium]
MASSATRRRRAGVLVVLALVAVVNSCRALTAADGIDWRACGPAFGVAEGAVPATLAGRMSCGRIEVPLDPGDTDLGTVGLAVARIAAAGSSRGTVVIDPGGPGGSGVGHLVGAALGLASQPIAVDHDLVAVDPRGVGASRPSLRCRTDAERDAERAMDFGDRSAAGVRRIEAYRSSVAERCRDRVGAQFLTRVGTAFVASDLDQVRRRLGVDAIAFVGHSYGTRLGIEYARRYPERLRAVVLDGIVDPAEDPVDATVAQMTGFGQAFDAFARDCVTRADCPLGDRADGAVEAYRRLVGPLIVDPAPAGSRLLSAGDAETGTIFALYQRARWSDLRRALGALGGGDGAGLLRLADAYEGRGEDGHYDRMQDAFLSISCADDRRLGEHDRPGELDRRIRAAAPFLDDGRATGRGPSSICELWPLPARSPSASDDDADAAWPAAAPTPVVVATTGDPATPYATSASFADEVGADLITVTGVDHTAVFAGDPCVDVAVGRYLADPTKASVGLTC